jgi:hypothetical protein
MTDTDVLYYADGDKAIIAATVAVQDARDAQSLARNWGLPSVDKRAHAQAKLRDHLRELGLVRTGLRPPLCVYDNWIHGIAFEGVRSDCNK